MGGKSAPEAEKRTFLFSDKWVQSAKVKEGRKSYYDTNVTGLGLRVSHTGRKVWELFYRIEGDKRSCRMDLGKYPLLELKDARERARELLNLAAKGIDPAGKQRAAKEAPTFGEVAEDYLKLWAKARKKESSAAEDARILKKDVLPAWDDKKILDITKRDVIALLDEVSARGVKVHANRVLALVRKIFNWAISRDLLEINPCAKVEKPAEETERDRVLNEAEIRAFWKSCAVARPVAAAALRIELVTAQRGGEILWMRWDEIDLETGWWSMPAKVAKNKTGHRVPLTAMAITILEALKQDSSSPWVFPSMKDGVRLTEIHRPARAVAKAMAEELGITAEELDFRPHDLRRTAATSMGSLEVPPTVISKVLNHKERGVTWIYNRYSYDAEKRQALDTWAERLQEILKP